MDCNKWLNKKSRKSNEQLCASVTTSQGVVRQAQSQKLGIRKRSCRHGHAAVERNGKDET